MVELRRVHMVAIKHVLRYLEGTNVYGLRHATDLEDFPAGIC